MRSPSRGLAMVALLGASACVSPEDEQLSQTEKVVQAAKPAPPPPSGSGGASGSGGSAGGASGATSAPTPTTPTTPTTPMIDACAAPGMYRPALHPYGEIWSGDEGASAALSLPFAFTFFGATQTRFWVTSNGELGFGDVPGGSPFGQVRCPLADPGLKRPVVLAYAADFLSSTICVATTGSAPNRKLVVTWKDAHLYELEGTGNGTSNLAFSAVLNEGGHAVDVSIDRVEIQSAFFAVEPVIAGSWAAVGVQAGPAARSFSCQQPNARPGTTFRHQP